MTELRMPTGGPRVRPLKPEEVSAYVRSEYDKSVNTWGIPNNLIRTMAWLPRLALTEVDYANSFIFDEGNYSAWPAFGGQGGQVLFPQAGFVDRVTKELVINLVSLLNRSRYSITHHTVIAYLTLRTLTNADLAEQLLLNLVNAKGEPTFEKCTYQGKPLYSPSQVRALRLATKLRGDAHDVTNKEFDELREAMKDVAKQQVTQGPLKAEPAATTPAYLDAYVNAMLVELTWCIVHFAGLLNKWFTVLRVADEDYPVNAQGQTFIEVYNSVVPESIKERNNGLLGADGWGGGASALGEGK